MRGAQTQGSRFGPESSWHFPLDESVNSRPMTSRVIIVETGVKA
jgi:hypothetical protein